MIGVPGRCTMFGTQPTGWKPFTMNDGTEVLVTEDFNYTKNEAGDTYMYPEGDTSVPPSGHMPKTGYFFDAIVRQPPIDEAKLDPADNMEEFKLLGPEDMAYYAKMRDWLDARSEYGVILVDPGRGVRRHRAGAGHVPETPQGDSRRRGMVRFDGRPQGLRPGRV